MDGMNDMGDGSMEQGAELSPMTPSPMISNEQCVPLEALAMPEEGDQLANPEPGDLVSYTVEGKVTRVEGQKAYVEPETVNGKPFAKDEAPPAAEEAGGYAALETEAGQFGPLN